MVIIHTLIYNKGRKHHLNALIWMLQYSTNKAHLAVPTGM